jgi:hypothetical protein
MRHAFRACCSGPACGVRRPPKIHRSSGRGGAARQMAWAVRWQGARCSLVVLRSKNASRTAATRRTWSSVRRVDDGRIPHAHRNEPGAEDDRGVVPRSPRQVLEAIDAIPALAGKPARTLPDGAHAQEAIYAAIRMLAVTFTSRASFSRISTWGRVCRISHHQTHGRHRGADRLRQLRHAGNTENAARSTTSRRHRDS